MLRPDPGGGQVDHVTKPVIDPFVNGLKSLVKSTLTREMTGTTDTDLQSKFQRFQCGQVPAAFSDRHKVCAGLPAATKGPYFAMLGSGFTGLGGGGVLLAGRCSVAKRILSGNVPSQIGRCEHDEKSVTCREDRRGRRRDFSPRNTSRAT